MFLTKLRQDVSNGMVAIGTGTALVRKCNGSCGHAVTKRGTAISPLK